MIWGIPFSFLVMLAVWNRYDRHIEEAARDLGANGPTTFREVTLPLVWTGIFGSFLFGFTLTWNDFDRTILLQSGYEAQPLPILIGTWPQSRPILPNLYALGRRDDRRHARADLRRAHRRHAAPAPSRRTGAQRRGGVRRGVRRRDPRRDTGLDHAVAAHP